MTMHVNVSGTWKEVAAGGLSAKVSGAWKTIQEGWVNVSGTWKQFFVNVLYDLPAGGTDTGAVSGLNYAQTAITMTSGGTFTTSGANSGTLDSGNWVTPTSLAPGSYTIRASLNSGSTPGGSALDTDLALTSNRGWYIDQSGVGSNTCQLSLTLKDGGGNTVATNTVDLTAEVLPV